MDAVQNFTPELVDESPKPMSKQEKKRFQRFREEQVRYQDFSTTYDEWCDVERQETVERCGQILSSTDLHSGSLHRHRARCHLYRLCKACLAERAEEYRAQVLMAASHCKGGLWVSTGETGSENIQEIKDGELKIKGYISFPLADESLLVFHKDEVAGARHVEMEELAKMDWTAIACTPEDRRIRGTLGKVTVATPADDNMVSVEINAVSTNAPVPMEIRCRDEAMHEVGLLDPHTIGEAVEASNNLMDAYARKLRSYGFMASVIPLKRKIKSVTPHWDSYRLYFLKGCASDPAFKADNCPKGG